jgi:hypothetical protein
MSVVDDRGIDFVLTPQERDQAVLDALYLEDRRRRLNEADQAAEARKSAPAPSLPPAIEAAIAPFMPKLERAA